MAKYFFNCLIDVLLQGCPLASNAYSLIEGVKIICFYGETNKGYSFPGDVQ